MRKFLLILLFSLPAMAQIPPPQIGLTGNLGCSGFPCVNSGTLIFASDADRTMTAQETSAPYIKVASSVSLTATRNLIAPAGRFPFSIENATTGGQSIQIIGTSGTGITIPNGQALTVWNDGTNYISFGSATSLPTSAPLLGTTSGGAAQTITLGSGLSLSGTTLSATAATLPASAPLLGTTSGSAAQSITLGTNLSLSGTVLNATGGGATLTASCVQYGASTTSGVCATLPQIGTSATSPTDGSVILNIPAYVPYTLGGGNVGNVFIGTGTMAYGSGTVGGFTGNNVAIGHGALSAAVNPGSVVAIGVQAAAALNGNGNTDPGAGNDVVIGANAGQGDATMADSIVIGQKSYVDTLAGSVGGLTGGVIVGVHTDGWDGGGDNTLVGDYIARYTNALPITGSNNTLLGSSILSCPSCSSLVGPLTANYDVFVGAGSGLEAFNSSYAIAIGDGAGEKFAAGNLSGPSFSSLIAIGNASAQNETTSLNVTAVGNNALQAATSASDTAVGTAACAQTTTGLCTAFGLDAGLTNATGNMTAFGVNAARNATGAVTDAFGGNACFGCTGSLNVAIGDTSMQSAGAATRTVSVGYSTGYADTSGYNTYVGYGTPSNAAGAVTGGYNTVVGAVSGGAFPASTNAGITANALLGYAAGCTGVCSDSEALGANAIIGGTTTGAAEVGAGTCSIADTFCFLGVPILTNTSGTISSPVFQTLASPHAGSFVWGDDGNTTAITTANTVYGFFANLYGIAMTVTNITCYSNDGTATVTIGYGTGSASNVGTIVTSTACAVTGTPNTVSVAVPAGDVLNFVPTGGASDRVTVAVGYTL